LLEEVNAKSLPSSLMTRNYCSSLGTFGFSGDGGAGLSLRLVGNGRLGAVVAWKNNMIRASKKFLHLQHFCVFVKSGSGKISSFYKR
jgi:hypothetical protein